MTVSPGRDRVPVDTADLWPDAADDDEGLVVNWFVREGSRVEPGDPLCEIQVEKVDVDVPAPVAGRVEEILLAEDAAFERGATLAYLRTA